MTLSLNIAGDIMFLSTSIVGAALVSILGISQGSDNGPNIFVHKSLPSPVYTGWNMHEHMFATSELPDDVSTVGMNLDKTSYECTGCLSTYKWVVDRYYPPLRMHLITEKMSKKTLDSGIQLFSDNTPIGVFKIYVFDVIDGNCIPQGDTGCDARMGCIAAVQIDFSPRKKGFIYLNYMVTVDEPGEPNKVIGGGNPRTLFYTGHGIPCNSYPEDPIAKYSVYNLNVSAISPIITYSLVMSCSKCEKARN